MKKLLLILSSFLLLYACSEDDFGNASRNVVTDNAAVSFEDLIFLVSLKASDSTYLVVKSIDSVSMYVNGNHWATVNSDSVDTSKVDHFSMGNKSLSSQRLNYLVLAGQEIGEPESPTAGGFADYLNAVYQLRGGEYACLIESFQVSYNDHTTRTYYPMSYAVFEVKENAETAFVGEFEFKID